MPLLPWKLFLGAALRSGQFHQRAMRAERVVEAAKDFILHSYLVDDCKDIDWFPSKWKALRQAIVDYERGRASQGNP